MIRATLVDAVPHISGRGAKVTLLVTDDDDPSLQKTVTAGEDNQPNGIVTPTLAWLAAFREEVVQQAERLKAEPQQVAEGLAVLKPLVGQEVAPQMMAAASLVSGARALLDAANKFSTGAIDVTKRIALEQAIAAHEAKASPAFEAEMDRVVELLAKLT